MGKHRILAFIAAIILTACQASENRINQDEFETLMGNVALGWSTQDTDLALSSFAVDAVYMEPPNIQYYRGHDQLRPYFAALTDEYQMQFHNLWFNEQTQSGAGEFTFSYGKPVADTGIAVVEIEDGKIKFWREYQQKGPANFEQFKQIDGKTWEWHIGNYP